MTQTEREQIDKFKQAARDLEADDDPERFKERVGKLVRHKPVEKPEPEPKKLGEYCPPARRGG